MSYHVELLPHCGSDSAVCFAYVRQVIHGRAQQHSRGLCVLRKSRIRHPDSGSSEEDSGVFGGNPLPLPLTPHPHPPPTRARPPPNTPTQKRTATCLPSTRCPSFMRSFQSVLISMWRASAGHLAQCQHHGSLLYRHRPTSTASVPDSGRRGAQGAVPVSWHGCGRPSRPRPRRDEQNRLTAHLARRWRWPAFALGSRTFTAPGRFAMLCPSLTPF